MVANSETVGDVYEMGRFLHLQGVTRFSVGLLSCSGSAKTNHMVLRREDVLPLCQQLAQVHHDFGLQVGFTGGVPFCTLPDDIDESVRLHNICDAAIHQIVIGPDGHCRPCVEHSGDGGNILTTPLEEVWKSSVFEEVRLFRNVPPECHRCRQVSVCHGGCRASACNYTGSITGRDPLMPEEVPSGFILEAT